MNDYVYLVKCAGSRKIIKCASKTLVCIADAIQQRFAINPTQRMIVQKISQEWNEFIDVESDDDIPEGGKLEVVLIEDLATLFDGNHSNE